MSREKLQQFWHTLIRWPGWTAWLKWNGWTAWLKWKVWKAIASWDGWRKAFLLPPLLVLPMAMLSAAALIWIFLTGRETSLIAYPVYVLSFYSLVTGVLLLPTLGRKVRSTVTSSRHIQKYLSDGELQFKLSLYYEQLINFLYGVFKIISGAFHASFWIGADGLYNLVQGIIQLVQILRRRKALTLVQQWKSYRLCGKLMLALHLTMTGLIFQMIHMDAFEEYPGYLILVTAMFAFYKLIRSFVDVARDRKHAVPIDSAVRLLNLSQALFSLFSLQVAMIHQFDGSEHFASLMNSLTGTAVCLMVVGIGVYMLRRSRREIKKLEESTNV